MTSLTVLLGRVAAALFVAVAIVAALELFGSPEARGRLAFSEYTAGLNRRLRFLRIPSRGGLIAALQGTAAAASLSTALFLSQPFLVVLLPAIAFLPSALLTTRIARRVAALEEQIEPWLNAIANALKASPSLGEAVAASASLVGAPMSQEVDVVIKEYELGTPLDRALDNFASRIGSRTLGGCVLALTIARRSGGNLPEMLENAASALREMARLEGVVRTKTAEGKAQAFVIGMIPAPMVLGLNWLDPTYLDPLLQTFTGHLVLAAIAVLWVSAILLSRKILDVDV
jgi:tight adherence protein B